MRVNYHQHTLEALQVWIKMYEEEELKILETKVGSITVPFLNVLETRFGNRRIRGTEQEFTVNCALIVAASKSWVYRIAQTKEQEYQLWLKAMTPEHFKRRSHTSFYYSKDQKNFKDSASRTGQLWREFNKTRGGSSDLGQEYDKEREWLQEDLTLLKSAQIDDLVKVTSKTPEAPVAPAQAKSGFESTFGSQTKKRQSEINVNLQAPAAPTDQQPAKPTFLDAGALPHDSTQEGDNKNEKLVIKNATITNALKGSRNEEVAHNVSLDQNESDTDGFKTTDNFSMKEILHQFQSFDPVNMLERYLSKFEGLFHAECQ